MFHNSKTLKEILYVKFQLNYKLYHLQESSRTNMGCVNSAKTHKKRGNAKNYQYTQPEMIHDDYGLQHLPHLEVSQRACGYNFIDSKFTDIVRTKTQYTVQSTLSSQIDELHILIDKCQYYYRQHDIDTAHDCLIQIQKYYQKYQHNPETANYMQKLLSNKQIFFQQVKEEYNDVIEYEREISRDGWIEKSNRRGIKISTRRQQSTVGVLVESIVDQPFQTLITVLIEMDLYKQFMPFMKISTQEKIVSRNCRIGHTQNHFPILSVRQAFFQGIGYNRLHKNNRLFLFTRSINNRPDLEQKLGYKCQVNPDYVQLQYKYLVLQYEPICRGKGRVSLAMNADTKMDFIPMWIQDMISQDFGEQFFENIVKISKKFKNSQWQRNTEANPDLFLFFKNAIDRHLTEMQEAQKPGTSRTTNTL